jgi:hypothetical protein
MIKTWKERRSKELDEDIVDARQCLKWAEEEINELRAALAERVPLSDEQMDSVLAACGILANFDVLRKLGRATEIAHNIKES